MSLRRVILVPACLLMLNGSNVLRAADSGKQQQIGELVNLIRTNPNTQEEHLAKVAAIKSAATVKEPSAELIEALLDNLYYVPPSGRAAMFNPMEAQKWELFPARDALRDLGDPVIPVLVKKIGATENEEARRRYIAFLGGFNKQKSAEAAEKALAEAPTEAEKARYRELLPAK
jgi:hypothetical protein